MKAAAWSRKKWRLLLGLAAGLPLTALAIVAICIWVEDRFPSDDPQKALLPGMQRVVSRPVVAFLSRQAERHVRARADLMFMNTGASLEETLKHFLDESVDLKERRIHAYRLARVGSPECIAALLKVLATAPPEHRAFMAQLIGSTGNPAAKEWLLPLLDDPDQSVVRAAIRGLSAIGGDDVTRKISAFLQDPAQPETIRIEAALGLGMVGTPAAGDALVRALAGTPSDDLAIPILDGLGRFEFPQVEATFTQILTHPETPTALKIAALEALANSSGDAVPYLLDGAEHLADPDSRAAAAWAISAHTEGPDCGRELIRLAGSEPEPDVRRRLYEAMLPQASVQADALLSKVQAEHDPAARVAGFNAIGAAIRREPASTTAGNFDREIAPELVRIATEPNSLNLQMRAVFALRRAGTPGARDALARIVEIAPPQVATAARHGLPATHP
jgi:HEAT repeat protein